MAGLTEVPRVSAGDARAGIPLLRKHGVVVVSGAFDPETIDRVRAGIMARHTEFAEPCSLIDYQNNGEGRFIAPVVVDRALWDSGVLGSTVLAEVAGGVLGEDWVVDALGLTMALPGCAAQKMHRDGTSLYPESPLAAMLPAFALTVMIPLVDVHEGEGTTAFRLGTNHYDPAREDADAVSTPLARGDLIVWDFETLHAGDAHGGSSPRPMLYLTLCRPFWTDTGNFGGSARAKLLVDADVVPHLDRRYARAASGRWAHDGLGAEVIAKY